MSTLKPLKPLRILGSNKILSALTLPANIITRKLKAPHIEQIAHIIDAMLTNYPMLGYKALEANDATQHLDIQQLEKDAFIECSRKCLIVDQNDVGALTYPLNRLIVKEITPDQRGRAGVDAVALAAVAEFVLEREAETVWVFHLLNAPCFAAGFERGLEHDTADAGSHVQEDLVGGQVGLTEEVRGKAGEELSIDVVGAVHVLAE